MEEVDRSEPSRPRASGERSRRRRVLAQRVALVLLVLTTMGACFGVGSYLTLRFQVSVPEITVPELMKIDIEEARERAEALGLRTEIAGRRHDAIEPAGKVLEQMPQSGTATKPGRTIKLVISLGSAQASVPDMRASSLRRAQLALRAEGLAVGSTASVNHPEVELGRVVTHQPPPGASVLPGGAVSLLLSAGPARQAFVMPALTGRPGSRVKDALERAGFRRVRLRSASGGRLEPAMTIVHQRPEPGRRVTIDDRILLDVGVLSLAEVP